jgi:hypothetical protein
MVCRSPTLATCSYGAYPSNSFNSRRTLFVSLCVIGKIRFSLDYSDPIKGTGLLILFNVSTPYPSLGFEGLTQSGRVGTLFVPTLIQKQHGQTKTFAHPTRLAQSIRERRVCIAGRSNQHLTRLHKKTLDLQVYLQVYHHLRPLAFRTGESWCRSEQTAN